MSVVVPVVSAGFEPDNLHAVCVGNADIHPSHYDPVLPRR